MPWPPSSVATAYSHASNGAGPVVRSAPASTIVGAVLPPPWPGLTVTVTVSVADLPVGSVALTVTVYVPACANVRVTDAPNALPSGNVHS